VTFALTTFFAYSIPKLVLEAWIAMLEPLAHRNHNWRRIYRQMRTVKVNLYVIVIPHKLNRAQSLSLRRSSPASKESWVVSSAISCYPPG